MLAFIFFMFTVYILYSESTNRFYIGYTGEGVDIRLQKHLAHHKGFTGKQNDWKIVYTEIYQTRQDAMRREKEIKKWKSRVMIERLIKSTE